MVAVGLEYRRPAVRRSLVIGVVVLREENDDVVAAGPFDDASFTHHRCALCHGRLVAPVEENVEVALELHAVVGNVEEVVIGVLGVEGCFPRRINHHQIPIDIESVVPGGEPVAM